ncbi:hypothetical protein B0H19DRAFT_1103798 [Mycena capillaripes]|nr:hypothetical protein B0H19DRAFT_1103798 [Mycena capillaripes]
MNSSSSESLIRRRSRARAKGGDNGREKASKCHRACSVRHPHSRRTDGVKRCAHQSDTRGRLLTVRHRNTPGSLRSIQSQTMSRKSSSPTRNRQDSQARLMATAPRQ